MFGSIFDFNRDGKTDAFEIALGLSIAFSDEHKSEKPDEECDSDFDFFDDEEDDDDSSEINTDILEDECNDLEFQLSEWRDKLFALEMDEPDDCMSDAHDRWERRKNLMEELISEIESQISEIEDLL